MGCSLGGGRLAAAVHLMAAALALPKDDETLAQIGVAAAHCADVDTKAAIEAAAAGEVATAELTRATRRFRDAEP
ncbi:MAG: hypothetical protein KC731_23510 [Myxococcales bacterium]|nr:hypothetical protein [Myxococcales bacterium]